MTRKIAFLMAALVLTSGLTSCAQIRNLTMTEAELSYWAIKDNTPCIRGYDVCITENNNAR